MCYRSFIAIAMDGGQHKYINKHWNEALIKHREMSVFGFDIIKLSPVEWILLNAFWLISLRFPTEHQRETANRMMNGINIHESLPSYINSTKKFNARKKKKNFLFKLVACRPFASAHFKTYARQMPKTNLQNFIFNFVAGIFFYWAERLWQRTEAIFFECQLNLH